MPENVVRYGVISTAQIAMNAHVTAAKDSHNSVITAVSSRGPEKAKQAADKYDIPNWYGSYEELLADPNIDAVINPLPTACTPSGPSKRRRQENTFSARSR